MTSPTPTEAHVIHFTERLLMEHRLYGWTVELDRATRRAGRCNYGTRTISFSRPLIKVRPLEENLMTARHEVAHALTGRGHGHDAEWRNIYIALGGDGARCFEMAKELLPHKYVGSCPKGHKSYFARAVTHRRSCGECSPDGFDERHEIKIVEAATGKPMVYAARRRRRNPRPAFSVAFGETSLSG